MSAEEKNSHRYEDESFSVLLPEGREAFDAGRRKSVEFLIGHKLSDLEWDNLVLSTLRKKYLDSY